jgi:hypothetical protein
MGDLNERVPSDAIATTLTPISECIAVRFVERRGLDPVDSKEFTIRCLLE